MVKKQPAVQEMQEIQEMQLQSLGWEDPLEGSMAIHASIFAWENPMDRGAWRAIVHGGLKELARSAATEHGRERFTVC